MAEYEVCLFFALNNQKTRNKRKEMKKNGEGRYEIKFPIDELMRISPKVRQS